MKKLILVLAIMLCTVCAYADSVISCKEFYKNAKPDVDNDLIEKVFDIIKHDPKSYICGRIPGSYIAVPKSPYDGFGAMVLVRDTSTALFNYIDDKATLLTVDNYGFVRLMNIGSKDYFQMRNLLIGNIKEDYSNCPPSWQDDRGRCKLGWYSN